MNAQIPALHEWYLAGGRGEYKFRSGQPGIEHTFCSYGDGWYHENVPDGKFVCDNIYYSADNDDEHTLWIDIMPNVILIDSTYYDVGVDISIDPSFFSTDISEEEIFQYITAFDIGFLDADTLKIAVIISKCL